MTGGLAWVYDADGSFIQNTRYHPEFIAAEPFKSVDAAAQEELRQLILFHVEQSESGLGRAMLADWPHASERFVKLTPVPQV